MEEEKEEPLEIKEFPLIQLDDLEIETESTSTIKPEETENTLFNSYNILERVFNDPFSQEFDSNQERQTNSPKNSEETNSTEEDSSDSKFGDSDLELNINIPLGPENLENIENIINMNAK